MCILDIVILVLLIPAVINGLRKGLVDQTIGLAAFIISGYLAYIFADKVGQWIGQYITVSPTVLYIIGFAVVVILCVLLFNLLARLMSGLLEKIGLGWLNKTLGVLVGILSTLILVGLALSLITDFDERTLHLGTGWISESTLADWCKAVANWVFPFLRDLFSNFSSNVPSV